jgi:hypothetical protein
MAPKKVKAKKGKKPSGSLDNISVSKGLKKAPAAPKGEVTGHMSPWGGAAYTCWACGAVNLVGGGYDLFVCWRCGALNRI